MSARVIAIQPSISQYDYRDRESFRDCIDGYLNKAFDKVSVYCVCARYVDTSLFTDLPTENSEELR